jgi:hypothetical protein
LAPPPIRRSRIKVITNIEAEARAIIIVTIGHSIFSEVNRFG